MGIRMVTRDGQTVVVSSSEEAQQRFMAGELGFAPGQELGVVDARTGETGTVTAQSRDDVVQALSGGMSILTDEQVNAERERRAQAEAAESPLGLARTVQEGLERGASLGLTDVARTQEGALGDALRLGLGGVGTFGGPETAEEARQGLATRREVNPGLSTGAEIAGAIATTRSPLPAGLATRAGLATERVIQGALTRGVAEEAARTVAPSLLTRAAARLGGGSVEGALFGGGQAITESALGDRELTADGMLAAMGTGALWGGAATGGLGLAGDAVGASVRRVGAGARRLGRDGQDALARLWARQTGNELRNGVAELYGRASSLATGADDRIIGRLTDLSEAGQRARRIVTNADDVIEQSVRDGRQLLDEAEGFARVVQDESIGRLKRDDIIRAARGANTEAAVADAVEQLQFIGAQADEMLTDSATWGARAAVRRISDDVATVRSRIDELVRAGGDDVAGDVFMELDDLKRRIGRESRPGRYVSDARDSDAIARIRQWYQGPEGRGGLRGHLERQDLYGEAASIQSDVNRAWTNYLDSAQRYRREFLTRVGQDGFNPRFTHDPGKLEGFLGRLGRARNEVAEETLRNHVQAQRELVETIGRRLDISDEARAALESGRRNAKTLDTYLRRVDDEVGLINQWRDLREAGANSNVLGLGAAGFAVGGAPGAALATAVSRPDQVVKTLAAIERVMGGLNGRITGSVRGLLQTGKRRTTSAARRITSGGRRATVPITAQAFESKVREVTGYLSSPEQQEERTATMTRDISGAAPGIADGMRQRSAAAAQFLRDRIPSGTFPQGHLQPHLARSSVPRSEMRRFLAYARAVEDPTTILDDIERGTVTREGVEVLREVYPHMYRRVQEETMQALAEMREQPPYRTRLQLGILLDIPADPSLQPASIAMMQSRYAPQPPEPQQAPPNAPPPETPDIAGAFQTETDRIASRRANV